jgi:hypothetical protein
MPDNDAVKLNKSYEKIEFFKKISDREVLIKTLVFVDFIGYISRSFENVELFHL